MRLGLVSTYTPRRHELAGPASALVRELARDHEVCVCAVDRHGLEYPDEVSAVITDDRPGDYARAGRILDQYGVDAVLVEYGEDVYGGSGGAHVLGLVDELRHRSVALAVRLHTLPHPGHESARVMAGLVEAASAVLVPSAYAARLVVGRVAGARRVVVVPNAVVPNAVVPNVSASPMARRPWAGAAGDRRTLTVLGALRLDRGLERAMVGVAKAAADHPDIRLVLAETSDQGSIGESTQDERGAYLEQLWMLAHDLGMADRITIHPDRLGPADRADLLARTTVLLVPNLPADRPAFGLLAEALQAGCATVAAQHPYAAEMLGSGAGLLLPDDEPESLAQAVGRLLGDVTRLEHARRVARTEGARFAGSVVARRVAEAMESLGTDDASESGSDTVTLRPTLPTRTVAVRLDGRHHTVSSRHEAARLGVVAAALAGTGAATVGVPEWLASVEWSRQAVAVLAATAGSPRPDGWSVRALAALSGPGLAPAVRERAAAELVRLTAGLDPADLTLDDAALVVLGLVDLGLRTGPGPHASAWSAAVARLTEPGPGWGPAWPWPTAHLTAEGARLPHALIVAGVAAADDHLRELGTRALDWYLRRAGLADADGAFTAPGGESATAVGAAVEALADAYRLTGARRFGRTALRAFAWFGDAGLTHAGPVTVSGALAYLGAAIALRDCGLATLSGQGALPTPSAA